MKNSRYQLRDRVALNVTETAEMLGLSRSTVYELMHREDFPAFKIGNRTVIPRQKLEEWANSQPRNF